MNWKPWNTSAIESPPVKNFGEEITEPPCKHCRSFKPQLRFLETESGMISDGVVICHAREMQADFSCYVKRNQDG